MSGSDWIGGAGLGVAFVLAGLMLRRWWGPGKPVRLLVWFLVGVSLFRIAHILLLPAVGVDLSGDEAQYWDWSRRMDWSFYSKGPVTAALIWVGRQVFGETVLAVRSPSVVLAFLTGAAMFLLGRRLYNETVGAWSGAIVQVVPLLAFSSLGATNDAPMIFLWVVSVLLFHRAWSSQDAWPWLALGLAVGLGIQCKYTMGAFYFCALLMLLFTPQGRGHLRRVWPYLGVLLSLAVLTPLFFWNAGHEWVNFRHNMGHTRLSQGMAVSLQTFLTFTGSQLGGVTPILLPMMVIALVKRRKTDPTSFWFSLPVMIFFTLKSIQGEVLVNWALIAYLTGIVSFAAFFLQDTGRFNRHVIRLVRAAVIVALCGTVGLYLAFLIPFHRLPLMGAKTPLKKLVGWRQMGEEVSHLAASVGKPLFYYSDKYDIASTMAFYLEGQPHTYCITFGPTYRRMNQFDLWDSCEGRVHDNAVFVTDGGKNKAEVFKKLAARFQRTERHEIVVRDLYGQPVNTFTVLIGYDFAGMERIRPASY